MTMQVPLSLKMSATWENEKLSSSIVPRICNLSITQVMFDRLVEEKLDNSRHFLVAVRMRDNTRRVLRSPELAFPASIPGIVYLNFSCSIQYSHALKRDSSNLLQLLIQRPKKYKKKSVNFGYKTLAYCTIDLAQVLQRKIENKLLDLYEDPKSFSHVIGRIEVQSLCSSPAEKDLINDRRKEFYEEEDEGMHDQFSEAEDSDRAEDSDFDPNCAEFGESRQKKIIKAMSVGPGRDANHRRSSSPSAALPEWQKQIKQKIMGLLKKVKLMEHNEVLDPRDQLWDEIDQFENASEDSDIVDMDTLSIQSTPRPMLRPFFNASILSSGQMGQETSEDTLNADGGAKLLKKLQLEVKGSSHSHRTNSNSNTTELSTTNQDKEKSLDSMPVDSQHHQHQLLQTMSNDEGMVKQNYNYDKDNFQSLTNTNQGPTIPSTTGSQPIPTPITSSITAPAPSTKSSKSKSNLKHQSHTNITTTNNYPSNNQVLSTVASNCQQQQLSSISTSFNSANPQLTSNSQIQNITTSPSLSNTQFNTTATTTSNTTNNAIKSKKPMSSIMKTFSLVTNSSTGNSTSAITNSITASSIPQSQHDNAEVVHAQTTTTPITSSTLSGVVTSSTINSPLSSEAVRCDSFGSTGYSSLGNTNAYDVSKISNDINPRPELIEQVNSYLTDYSDSLSTIYIISLSDLGGKYVSDLFYKEHIPHILLASFGDTKFAISQIVSRIRKRNEIVKICLLGGDCHLNNVLRVFIDQMNLNYSCDLLSCFRFFLIPITGLYSNSTTTGSSNINGFSNYGNNNTMSRRLCNLDSKYAHLFAEFILPSMSTSSVTSPTSLSNPLAIDGVDNICASAPSGDNGSSMEKDNKFLFAVQDYLQANSTTNFPIGECLIACKVKPNLHVTQDTDSSSESFLPFFAEVRLGDGNVLNDNIVSSSTTSFGGGGGTVFRMDSSMDEQWLSGFLSGSPVTSGCTTANSPPRSPVIGTSQDSNTKYTMNLSSSLTKELNANLCGTSLPSNIQSTNPDSNNTTSNSSATTAPISLINNVTLNSSMNITGSNLTSNTNSLQTTNTHVSNPTTITTAAAAANSTQLTSTATLATPVNSNTSPDVQLEYWTDHSSKKICVKSAFRQMIVSPPPISSQTTTIPNLLTLTIISKEKKQKIMRIAKKPKHDTGDTKKETFDDVSRILCSSKNQNSEIKVFVDGVMWSNVKFFQLSPCWRTQVKSFPIATFI